MSGVVVPFRRAPRRAWHIANLDGDIWIAHVSGPGAPRGAELGTLESILVKLQDASRRRGLPILIVNLDERPAGAA